MVHWKYTLVLAYLMIARPVFSSDESYDDDDDENDDEEDDDEETDDDEGEDDEEDAEDSDDENEEEHDYSDYRITPGPHRTPLVSSQPEDPRFRIPHRIQTSQGNVERNIDRYKYMVSTDSINDRSTYNVGTKRAQKKTSTATKKHKTFKDQRNHKRVEDNKYDVEELPLIYPRGANRTTLAYYSTKASIDIYKEGVKISDSNYIHRRSNKKPKLKPKPNRSTLHGAYTKDFKTPSSDKNKDSRRHFTDDQITQNKLYESPTKTTLAMKAGQETGNEYIEHIPRKHPTGRTTLIHTTMNLFKDKRNNEIDHPTRVGMDPTVIYYEELPLSDTPDTKKPRRTTVVTRTQTPEPSSTMDHSTNEDSKDSDFLSEDKSISESDSDSNGLSAGKSESDISKIKRRKYDETKKEPRKSKINIEKSSKSGWKEYTESDMQDERESDDEDLEKPVMKSSLKPTMKKYNILEEPNESSPSSTWKHYTRTTTLPGPTPTTIIWTETPEAQLECYSCEHTPTTPSKMCLDPETFNDPHSRDITMICDYGEKCYTAALFRGNELYTVLRGCRSHCFRTDDYICCDERLCNKDAFELPISLRGIATVPNRTTAKYQILPEQTESSGEIVEIDEKETKTSTGTLAAVSLGLMSIVMMSALAKLFATSRTG